MLHSNHIRRDIVGTLNKGCQIMELSVTEQVLTLIFVYPQVLAGIKIYLTKLMFTQKSHLTDEEAVSGVN